MSEKEFAHISGDKSVLTRALVENAISEGKVLLVGNSVELSAIDRLTLKEFADRGIVIVDNLKPPISIEIKAFPPLVELDVIFTQNMPQIKRRRKKKTNNGFQLGSYKSRK